MQDEELFDKILAETPEEMIPNSCFVVSHDIHNSINQLKEYKNIPIYKGYFSFERNKAMLVNHDWYKGAINAMFVDITD